MCSKLPLGSLQAKVFAPLLSNFICKLLMMTGETLFIFGHDIKVIRTLACKLPEWFHRQSPKVDLDL